MQLTDGHNMKNYDIFSANSVYLSQQAVASNEWEPSNSILPERFNSVSEPLIDEYFEIPSTQSSNDLVTED